MASKASTGFPFVFRASRWARTTTAKGFRLASSLEKTLGGRGSLLNDTFLESIGLGVDQRLEIGDMGLAAYYKKAAAGQSKYVNRAGQIDSDVQAGNETAKVNRAMQVRDSDLAYITKIKDLALSGGLGSCVRGRDC